MLPPPDSPLNEESSCEVTDDPATADLAWLTHQGAATVTAAFDNLAVEHGLADLRDWLVLSVAADGSQRTQLEIATVLSIDKSTMVLVLDRLERNGLIVRTSSASDRRVRIPEITPAGESVRKAIDSARHDVSNQVLVGVAPADRATFRDVLWHLAQQSR